MLKLLKKHENHQVDDKTQKMINTPLKKDLKLDENKQTFIKLLLEKIENKTINPHVLKTLYNKDIYEKLSEEEQEKTDLVGHNILSIIRQIEQLWKLDHKESFQIDNLVDSIYQMKSKTEEKFGDVYII